MTRRSIELFSRRMAFALALAWTAVPMSGCGGGVDESEPAEIDQVMEDEAALSDQYMMDQEQGN